MNENFKIGDKVRLKEDSVAIPAFSIPAVSKHLVGKVLCVKEDTIYVEYEGFFRSWGYSKYFELVQ